MEPQNTAISTPGTLHSETQKLAYKLWELAGCPSGFDLTFWLHAESQVLAQMRDQQSVSPSAGVSSGRSGKAAAVKSGRPRPAKRAASSTAVPEEWDPRKALPLAGIGHIV
jgi:hypothetical protein